MKTLKEFDYDLWAVEENGKKRYFARVKATGEVTEVGLNVMRFLMKTEKKMRRKYAAMMETGGMPLSLDQVSENEENETWMIDSSASNEQLLFSMYAEEIEKLLAPMEVAVFRECLLGGNRKADFAKEHGITKQSVQTVVKRIREKSKKYF